MSRFVLSKRRLIESELGTLVTDERGGYFYKSRRQLTEWVTLESLSGQTIQQLQIKTQVWTGSDTFLDSNSHHTSAPASGGEKAKHDVFIL